MYQDIKNASYLIRELGHNPFCEATRDALLDWVEEHPHLMKELFTSILPSVKSEEIDPRFAKTEYVVEATDYEALALWREKGRKHKEPQYHLTWKQENPGIYIIVGYFLGNPIAISCFWSIINGHRIMFWETPSDIISKPIINKWLDLHCDPRDQFMRQCRVNAMNFGSCLQYCHGNIGIYQK